MCDTWLQNKLVNPDTGRQIKLDGPTYKAWKAKCKDDQPNDQPRGQPKGCNDWLQNKLVNPDTGRQIKLDGPTYRAWKAKCKEGQPTNKPRGWSLGTHLVPNDQPALDALDGASVNVSRQQWIKERISMAYEFNSGLNDLDINQWEFCLSSRSKLLDSLTNVRTLGQGSFGQVRLGYLNNIPVAIKEAKLGINFKKKILKQEDPDISLFPEENIILDLTNNFILQKKSPNFVLQYHVALCKQCAVGTVHSLKTGMCATTFMEPATGTLAILKDESDTALQISLLYQLLLAVALIHQEFQLIHYDIKLENILIKATPELKGTYFVYVTPRGTFFVPNQGYLLMLADFGVAYSLGPMSITKEYGLRNAKVVTKGNKLKLQPITYDNPSPYYQFTWIGSDGQRIIGSANYIGKDRTGANLKINEPIDITKPLEYPPQEFGIDTQDVLNTFMGGKRASQPGRHPGFTYLNSELRELLNPYQIDPKLGSSISVLYSYGPMSITTGVYKLLALELLKKIYVPPAKPRSQLIISGVFNST